MTSGGGALPRSGGGAHTTTSPGTATNAEVVVGGVGHLLHVIVVHLLSSKNCKAFYVENNSTLLFQIRSQNTENSHMRCLVYERIIETSLYSIKN
jgi:hypothetical protein